MKLSSVLVPGLLLGLAIPSVTRADLAPSPFYVERCKVRKEQRRGQECILCGDAYHGDRDACEKRHAGAGYERRCKTRGASSWDEVWCRPSAAASTGPDPSPVTGKGCSLVAGSDGFAGMGWLLAVLGLGLAGSRRRRELP